MNVFGVLRTKKSPDQKKKKKTIYRGQIIIFEKMYSALVSITREQKDSNLVCQKKRRKTRDSNQLFVCVCFSPHPCAHLPERMSATVAAKPNLMVNFC